MLRNALEADGQAIANIWRAAWASANPGINHLEPLEHWHARVRAEFTPPNQTSVCETGSGEMLAFIVVNTDDAYLQQIFVHPHAQRKGTGAELLAHVRAVCPAGWSLHVAKTNDGARRFYTRHGLVEGPASRDPVTNRERVLYSWQPTSH